MERAELKSWVRGSGLADERGDFVFLRDAQWSIAEQSAVDDLARVSPAVDGRRGWLCLPTGGTSGRVRFARHDEATLTAAVSAFCLHFDAPRVNAVGVLPLHHVSGLMARIRCEATGGIYCHWDWKRLAGGEWPTMGWTEGKAANWFISLVPTQLQNLLERPGGADFLRRFRAVFVGGGPTWAKLEDLAAEERVPVALSYGMTETAAMVATQTPSAFLEGARDVGHPLSHAKIEVFDESGQPCIAEVPGRIRVSGESVFRGYFPDFQESRLFDTEDLGVKTGRGTLRILGRRDSAIITGGKKVWPAEIEAVLRATAAFADLAVLGLADPRWGESVVACYPADGLLGSLAAVKREVESVLPPYKFPKRFIAIAAWPRNAQGKLNREMLRKIIEGRSVEEGIT